MNKQAELSFFDLFLRDELVSDTTPESTIIGVDIAKFKFDVAVVLPGSRSQLQTFANSQAGFESLLNWLRQDLFVDAGSFCMEATGRYWQPLALFLHRAGHSVSVVNPACIKSFGQTTLKRSKNDSIDARLIAQYCLTMHPPEWTPPDTQDQDLQELVRHLHSLQDMLTQEKNRVKSGSYPSAVEISIRQHIDFLQEQIKSLDKQINQHINAHPELSKRKKLLISIPGIASPSANALLAELGNIRRFSNVRQLVAFAGLVPCENRSGTHVGKTRMSKVGSARLRKTLYFPAVVARRYNPSVKAFCARLETAGKSKMVAIGAAMRKLLHIIFGVLKTETPFNAKLHLQQA